MSRLIELIPVILLLLWAPQAFARQIFYNPNDERFKALYLEKVQSDYKVQKEAFNRQQILYQKGLISESDFLAAEARFKTAQITYQQAILALAFEQPHITIDKAIKYQSKKGKKKVRLTLRNTTGGLITGRKIAWEDFANLPTDQISNVYVSLLNDEGAIISQPYEAKIAVMPYNQPVTLDFLLLQNLDNVTVKSIYGDKSEEKKIFLQKDESANRVLITSEQFSQEADLGRRADYDLTLELFSSTDNVYKLEVLNLPRQITYDFFETETQARLAQVKFSQTVNTRRLTLATYLPDRYDSTSFIIDQPLRFFAAIIPRDQVANIRKEASYSTEQLDQLNISYLPLELVPRGVGRLQVRASNFYQELKPEENALVNLTVYNDGTRRLDNIKVRVDGPLHWTVLVVPDLISTLLPGKEARVAVTITPPADVGVGDYEATIKTESFAGNRKVASEDKRIRIHVAAPVNLWGTAILVALLVASLVGVVIVGVRLSRR